LDETTPRPAKTVAETGSFRDWDGRVFSTESGVLRAVTRSGLAEWRALEGTDFYARFTESGELVLTEETGEETVRGVQHADPEGGWVAALSHERAPFVSYPYEWSFSMLKDAALLQLRLMSAALAEGFVLKDASPYNVQWRGAQPVFIDVGSFERARAGEPWAGYRQFCMLYLYPLMLEAYRGVPFQPWLRGSVDGIAPSDFRALFTARDAFRPGMLRDVFLHASLERRYADRGAEVKQELDAAGFDSRLIESTVARLARLVTGLRSRAAESAWEDYRRTCSYTDHDTDAKERFVRSSVEQRSRSLVWDLGCNDGRYARIAAETAAFTVAIDSDRGVVDALYSALRGERNSRILPLVADVADPSPPLGWRQRERLTLLDRGNPDLVLCLAFVHHLSISRNVPLREIVDWLRDLDCEVVVEFAGREDTMVQRLLGGKRTDAHPDYERVTFEGLLEARFEVVGELELPSGTRTLYFVRPR
jgi:SAM-dependent methyltransferase